MSETRDVVADLRAAATMLRVPAELPGDEEIIRSVEGLADLLEEMRRFGALPIVVGGSTANP